MIRLSASEVARLGIKIAPMPTFARPVVAQRKDPLTVQRKLYDALLVALPGACWEFQGAVPGRRYTIDIAYPSRRIAVEVDGWQYHGRFKTGFHRDREKRNLLALQGWVVLAYTAKRIHQDLAGIINEVRACQAIRPPEPSA